MITCNNSRTTITAISIFNNLFMAANAYSTHFTTLILTS